MTTMILTGQMINIIYILKNIHKVCETTWKNLEYITKPQNNIPNNGDEAKPIVE